MKASLLLLFVLFHCASASLINWNDCGEGKTAYCACVLSKRLVVDYDYAKDEKLCEFGFHIKPTSTNIWTISIMNQGQNADPKEVRWAIDSQQIFKCVENKATFGEGFDYTTNKLSMDSLTVSPTQFPFCSFTVVSQGKKISAILEEIQKKTISKKTKITSDKLSADADMVFSSVDLKIPCKADKLFKKESCEKDEDCDEPTADTNDDTKWKCKSGYVMMLHETGKGKKFKNATIKCYEGNFIANDHIDSPLSGDAVAKCARKKCSLCQPKDAFMSLYQKPAFFGECASLKCTNGTFMVVKSTKDGNNNNLIATPNSVKCSVTTKTNAIEDARWVVEDEVEIDIESAECKKSVKCDLFTQIIPSCNATVERCEKPHLNSSGVYECRSGVMHVIANETDVRIDPPQCMSGGQWNVTLHSANSSSSKLWEKNTPLLVKCILDAVAKKAAPAQSSYTWIIVLVVVLVLILAAIGIGVFVYLKRKNQKKPGAAPVPSKTSSSSTTSNTSKKPSSSENEPLTSAMNSTTGSPMKTAIPQKPTIPTVVLAKADLRGITAAASSDPSSKSERRREKIDDKREEKTARPSEETATSKKQDSNEVASKKEKLMPVPGSSDELKSQTGGDGEDSKKNEESAKLLPKATPRKYSKSSTKTGQPKKKKKNDTFLQLTDSDDDGPSQTGSKKKRNKK